MPRRVGRGNTRLQIRCAIATGVQLAAPTFPFDRPTARLLNFRGPPCARSSSSPTCCRANNPAANRSPLASNSRAGKQLRGPARAAWRSRASFACARSHPRNGNCWVFRVWTKASVLYRLAGNFYRQEKDSTARFARSVSPSRRVPPCDANLAAPPGAASFFRSRSRKRPGSVGPFRAGRLRISRRALASRRHRHGPWRPWRP
jgi:hypothetical protein